MKTKRLIPDLYFTAIPLAVTVPGNAGNTMASYIIGAFIAVFMLAYLVYTLLRPDKF